MFVKLWEILGLGTQLFLLNYLSLRLRNKTLTF